MTRGFPTSRRLLLGAAALLSFAAAAAAEAPAGLAWDTRFGRSEPWNDGNAEVATYAARDMKEGTPRSSRAVLIVVAEDLSRDKLVKADRPGQQPTLRVLKLNHVRSIVTGVYSFQQMLSVFLGADRLEPVKLSMTSHDWCGNSFLEWRSDRSLLSIRSYFESAGDSDLPLAPGEAVFYDALPLKLRSLDFEKSREGRMAVLDTVFASSPSAPRTREAILRITPSGGSAYRVEMTRGNLRDVFDFDAAPPHRLLAWERADGGSLKLLGARRFRYWEKNHPGDESLLPGPGAD